MRMIIYYLATPIIACRKKMNLKQHPFQNIHAVVVFVISNQVQRIRCKFIREFCSSSADSFCIESEPRVSENQRVTNLIAANYAFLFF